MKTTILIICAVLLTSGKLITADWQPTKYEEQRSEWLGEYVADAGDTELLLADDENSIELMWHAVLAAIIDNPQARYYNGDWVRDIVAVGVVQQVPLKSYISAANGLDEPIAIGDTITFLKEDVVKVKNYQYWYVPYRNVLWVNSSGGK